MLLLGLACGNSGPSLAWCPLHVGCLCVRVRSRARMCVFVCVRSSHGYVMVVRVCLRVCVSARNCQIVSRVNSTSLSDGRASQK